MPPLSVSSLAALSVVDTAPSSQGQSFGIVGVSQAQSGTARGRGAKSGGSRKGVSQKVSEIGRKFSVKSYAICRILFWCCEYLLNHVTIYG